MCLVCDFERENHRSEIFVYGFCVYLCVCVCDFRLKNHKSKFVFLILGLAGHEGTGPTEARRGRFGVKKKTRLINRPGLGFWGRPAGQVQI